MKRRKLLAVGGALALETLAGCSGDQTENAESTPTPEEESGNGASPEAATGGETTFQVDTPTAEIDWGEQYEVTVKAAGGEDATTTGTVIVYQTERDSTWTGGYDTTEFLWQLDPGETTTETFEVEPTAVGEQTMALMTSDQDVVAEWQLTVTPPTAAFGETISYYDGLDLTLEAAVQEWMDFTVSWEDREGTDVHSVRPKNGQWVTVDVVAENTTTSETVHLPGDGKFSALSGTSQLDGPRSLGTKVGAGTEYEIGDTSRTESWAWMEMYSGGVAQQEGYWYPPRELVSGAVEEGWILFVGDEDTTVDDLKIRLNRDGIDVRATWTNE